MTQYEFGSPKMKSNTVDYEYSVTFQRSHRRDGHIQSIDAD